MGLPILILGKSGSGKSTSLRNFKENEVGIINVLGKQFPFKNNLIIKGDHEGRPYINHHHANT
jgi:ABC-type polar amino acid transport system ATPase subunit